MADITKKNEPQPKRRDPTYPRVVKQARHNACRVKSPGHRGTRHPDPVTISLVKLRQLTLAPESHDQLKLSDIGSDLAVARADTPTAAVQRAYAG